MNISKLYKPLVVLAVVLSLFYPNTSSAQAAFNFQSILSVLSSVVNNLRLQLTASEGEQLLSQVISAPLSKGVTSSEVKTLQKLLDLPEDSVTGYFGTITENAVKTVQIENNLAPTGVANSQVVSLLVDRTNKEASRPIVPVITPVQPPLSQIDNPGSCNGGYCLSRDGAGWTQLTPSNDTKISYVSTSGTDSPSCAPYALSEIVGDVQNPTGSTRSTGFVACKTINYAYSNLRDNMPDWLLLKRGDTWNENLTLRFPKAPGGRSYNEPMVISSYGTSSVRPKITGNNGVDIYAPSEKKYTVLSDIHVVGSGITMSGLFSNFLIENMYVERGLVSLQIASGKLKEFSMRRNIVTEGPSLGLIVSGVGVDGVLEENLFHHNGYDANGNSTIFNHHIYVGYTPGGTGRFNVINNIFTDGADGGKYVSGNALNPAVIENNTYLRNSAIYACCDSNTKILNNVVIDGRDRGAGVTEGGYGMNVGLNQQDDPSNLSTMNIEISGNVLAHQNSATASVVGVTIGPRAVNTSFKNNVIYNWCNTAAGGGEAFRLDKNLTSQPVVFENNRIDMSGCNNPWIFESYGPSGQSSLFFSNVFRNNKYNAPQGSTFAQLNYGSASPFSFAQFAGATGETGSFGPISYPDANRDAATYYNSLFGTSYAFKSTAGLNAFVEKAKQQNRFGTWDSRVTADAFNNYIRQGFGTSGSPTGPMRSFVQGGGGTASGFCRPDLNRNSILDAGDFVAFQNAFQNGSMTADFEVNQVLNVRDFMAFINAFAAGCPGGN